MKKVKFIYNPYSGENSVVTYLDKVVMIHQKHGYLVIPYRIDFQSDLDKAFEDLDKSYKYILIAGGDGTVDRVVNHMKKLCVNLPIAILPTGTANDFAKIIGMSLDIEVACKQILNSKGRNIDLGKINDKYFINVASTGLFTDISQTIDINLKNTIGKLAYYVKALEQLPNFRKLKIKVKSEDMVFNGDMYLMLIFNGQTAGNFKFAYKAEIDDGFLDVIIIKAGMIKDTIISLFIKMLRGEHLDDENGLLYFKTNRIEVECYEDIVTDIDGERGPEFPLVIECERNALKVLGIKNKELCVLSEKNL